MPAKFRQLGTKLILNRAYSEMMSDEGNICSIESLRKNKDLKGHC